MKRRSKVNINWGPELAYAIGLITSDGNLSTDGRHIVFVSKDGELARTFKRCLNLDNAIGRRVRGGETEKRYFIVQFGDKNFYKFLTSIGLMAAKSRKLKSVQVPDDYFVDFFRGCIDGDGTIGTFSHPETTRPQIRLRLASASRDFLEWIHGKIKTIFQINRGWISSSKCHSGEFCYYLCFGNKDSLSLLKSMYYDDVKYFLPRKREIASRILLLQAGVV